MTTPVPYVAYLELGDTPRLVAVGCVQCGARYLDGRAICAACGAEEFVTVPLPSEGHLHTFTIVHAAAPGIETPFIAAIIDCEGMLVPGRILGVPPEPDALRIGMPVRLVTYSVGVDGTGTEAVNYAFSPC